MSEIEDPWWSEEEENLFESLHEVKDHFARFMIEYCVENKRAIHLLIRMSNYGNLTGDQYFPPTAFQLIERLKNLYMYFHERQIEDIMFSELIESISKLNWDERSFCDKEIIDYILK